MSAILDIVPLSDDSFAPYGDVIEMSGAEQRPINQGTTIRYHDLARVDVGIGNGEPLISIFRGQPRPIPIRLEVMERHPLGSQAFYPLQDRPWLVVVSNAADPCDPTGLRAFRATGTQGVNYTRNIWHHPLLVLQPDSDFLVVDRAGGGENLQELWFPQNPAEAVTLAG